MEKPALSQAAANRDSHVRLDQRPYTLGNLAIRIIGGRLGGNVGAPVADIGCDSNHDAPRAPGNSRLESFADRALAGPVFARETLTYDDHRRGTLSVPLIEGAPQ